MQREPDWLRAAILMLALGFLLLFTTLAHAEPQNTGSVVPWLNENLFGATGVIIPNGKLCTYQAGTSTPLATFSEKTLTSSNANPMILNSQGRPQADIFLDAVSYKFVLRTVGLDATCSTGTVVWTRDDVYDKAALYRVEFATKMDDKVCHASQYLGTTPNDEGGKLAACVTALPSAGGTIAGSGLEGAQAWSACPFTGVTKPINVILGIGTHSIAVDCTIPVNVTLELGNGAIVSQATSTTLTITGPVVASMSQHFTGAGSFALSAAYAPWFNAKCDGATDDSAAFTKLVASTRMAEIPLMASTCRFGTLTIDVDGTTLRGVGGGNRPEMNQLAASWPLSAIFVKADNVTLDGFKIGGGATAGTEADENIACVMVTYRTVPGETRSNLVVNNMYLSGKVAGTFSYQATNAFAASNWKFTNNLVRTVNFGIYVGGFNLDDLDNVGVTIHDNDIQVSCGTYAVFYNCRPLFVWNAHDVSIQRNKSLGGFSCIELISSPATGLEHRRGNVVIGNDCDSHMSVTQMDTGIVANNVVDMRLRTAAGLTPAYDYAPLVAVYNYLPGIEAADNNDTVTSGNVVYGAVGAGIDFGANIRGALTSNIVRNSGDTASPPVYAACIAMPYGNNDDSVIANNVLDDCAASGIWQWQEVTQPAWIINRLLIANNSIHNTQHHAISLRNVIGVSVLGNRLYNMGLAAANTYDGVNLSFTFSGTIVAAIVRDNVINGSPRYGILQDYLDAASNRLTFIQNNTMVGTPGTSAFWIYGHRGGNWNGDNTAQGRETLTVTSNTLDLRSGIDYYNVADTTVNLNYLAYAEPNDAIRFHFNGAAVTLINNAAFLGLAGSANVTPTAGSEMQLIVRSNATPTQLATMEVSRMIR